MTSHFAKQGKPATAARQHNSALANRLRPAQDDASFVDKRPDAVAQAKLIAMMHGSAQVMQQQAFSDSIHNNSRMVAQCKAHDAMFGAVAQLEAEAMPRPNHTGLPDNLKAGVEALSGLSMDHVRVHYNSSQPAQLNAHAYAQGSEIHLAPGQEQHLPHEAWHVVQQAQGRVQPTLQMKAGVAVNDDRGLENEADVMGAAASGLGAVQLLSNQHIAKFEASSSAQMISRTGVSAVSISKRNDALRSPSNTVQRQVRNVAWNYANVPVPGQQILDNFANITDINCTLPQLTAAVTNRFRWIGTADMPTQVAGTTKSGRPNGAGNGTSHTAKIGNIGRDEFLIKRGQSSEAFEGGHLFGRALWDANDRDVANMNTSFNLVPMSRGLNIYSYADEIETRMAGATWRRWTVTPTRNNYAIPEGHLANVLGLPLNHGANGNHQLNFRSWISDNVNAAQGGVVRVANENPLLGAYQQADDGPTLIALLQQSNSWHFLTDALKADVAAL